MTGEDRPKDRARETGPALEAHYRFLLSDRTWKPCGGIVVAGLGDNPIPVPPSADAASTREIIARNRHVLGNSAANRTMLPITHADSTRH